MKKIIFVLFLLLLLTACQSKPQLVSNQQFVLDTLVTIKVYPNKTNLKKTVSDAFRIMKKIEGRFNLYNTQSETAKINRQAGKQVKISPQMADLLKTSQEIYQLTDGRFDITIRPVLALYNFGGKGKVPSKHELVKALNYTGFKKLNFNYQERLLKLKPRMALDFGGIIKGKAVDLAVQVLKKAGLKSGLVSTVSSISVLGPKPDGSPWRVGIQAPDNKNALLGVLEIKKGNMSTSGSYQQFFRKNGRLYHHLIDPKTGLPAKGLKSVTVVTTKSNAFADALSTGLFVLGKEKGLKVVQKLKGVEAIFVDDKGKVTIAKKEGQPLFFLLKNDKH